MGVSRCIARWATLVVFTTAILQSVGGRQRRAVYPRPIVRLLHFKLSTTVTKFFIRTNSSMWKSYEKFHCMVPNICRSQFLYSVTLGSAYRVSQTCITQASVSRLSRPVRNRYAAYVRRLAAASAATAEEPGAGGARHSRASPRVDSLTSRWNLRNPHVHRIAPSRAL